MQAKPGKNRPAREALQARATILKDAPAMSNAAQYALWEVIGGADGWASMSRQEKARYRARHEGLARSS